MACLRWMDGWMKATASNYTALLRRYILLLDFLLRTDNGA